MPTSFLNNGSPYENLYEKDFDINRLKVFSCLYYVSTIQVNRQKHDPRAKSNIFLGLNPITKGYITYGLKNNDIKISRNIFYENDFPDKTSTTNNNPHLSLPLHDNKLFYHMTNLMMKILFLPIYI